jgi:hypothetical protein
LLEFVAREVHLFRIDDNNVVTAIHVGGKDGFMLTPQEAGRFGGNVAQSFTGRVDYIPLAFHLTWFGHIGGHFLPPVRITPLL